MGKEIDCPNCDGIGFMRTHEKCDVCKGTGKKLIVDDWGIRRKKDCFACKATGWITDTDTCTMCGGTGKIEV